MTICTLCPRYCSIQEGHTGFCGVRECRQNQIVLTTYGRNTGLAVDPIEKKPLYHFFPASKVLSLGSVGCNLNCRFCQNYRTSRSTDPHLLSVTISSEEIVRQAKLLGCVSVAFTYNEPVIWAEYACEIARCCRREGIKTVAVSNGFISPEFRHEFFDLMDAANIDLKSFSDEFYKKYCNGQLESVLETITDLSRRKTTWLEVTTLLIPTLNNSDTEIEAMSEWFAKKIGLEVPLHFSAFHPAHQLTNLPPTPPQILFRAREIAQSYGLRYVYTGNINDPAGQATYCPQCSQTVMSRTGYHLDEYNIDTESCCQFCGQTIAGCFDETEKRENHS